MKKFGWFSIIFGSVALIGSILGNKPSGGPVFWILLGGFLLYKADKKAAKKRLNEQGKDNNTNNQ
ncbi:MAG: hypothetical protein K2H84_02925 [Paramuribaculum sp.]|nr:hypothetical protein [Paramuribaculum sp.]